VGFNRRFAPLLQELAAFFARTSAPLVINYRVHAGQMSADSWYLDAEHGTRFAGEAGHFLDVIAFLTGSRPVAVTASALRPSPPTPDDLENVAATVEYEDGSVGVLLYLTQGSSIVPKESIEVFGGGQTAHLDNFNSVTFYGSSRKKKTAVSQNKGQKNQMRAFVEAISIGGPMPIPLDSLIDTTLVTLAAQESIRTGQRILLDQYRLA
jgi:predicted dehydrogenase